MLGSVPPPPGAAPRQQNIDAVLDMVREQLGMQVAFISERVGDSRRFRNISSVVPLPVAPGSVEPYEGTYCQLISDGLVEPVVPDASADERTRDAPHTNSLGIGSYLGVPLRSGDGTQYGTLCAFSRSPRPDLRQRDADVLRGVASILMGLVGEEDQSAARRQATLTSLRDLAATGGPRVRFEPLVSLTDGDVVGAEARARYPDGRSAEEWFDAAAEVGRGTELELGSVARALEQAGDLPGMLAINLSVDTICSPAMRRLADVHDLERLVVEVSEHERVVDYQRVVTALRPLRRDGLRIAVDDVGAAMAGMRHVLLLEPDLVKLDAGLVRDIGGDARRQAFVEALTDFADKVDAVSVAEGIESADDLEWARELGADLGQGSHLGAPTTRLGVSSAVSPDAAPMDRT